MAKVTEISNEKGTYIFDCPGCKCSHAYYTSGPVKWGFNGDVNNPTFTPSLKNTYPDGKVCHLFVKNGKIEYCGDCFHELKGQTVEMEEIEIK